MSFDSFPEDYLSQVKSKYLDRRKDQFKGEADLVKEYFAEVRDRLSANYTFDKVLAVGGTGIVHTGHHNRFYQSVVLKINRPIKDSAEASMVEKEAHLLPELVHPNIISVLDLATLCRHGSEFCDCTRHSAEIAHDEGCNSVPKLTYLVEPFIEGSKPFFAFDEERIKDTWLYSQLTELKESMPDALVLGGGDAGQASRRITEFLRDVTAIFSHWVDLLHHLHKHGYVYIDVKPENVLIDKHRHLTAIDFGSVEKLDPEDQTPTDVFFTERYAHPLLIQRVVQKASSNRVRGGIKRAELSPHFDYFALGVSMLEILNEIAKVREHLVPQLPLYRALHFLATRLLDGKNATDHEHDYPFAKQVFPGLRDRDYRNLAYRTLDDTYRDLQKERGRWNLEDKVPELATFSKDIVRVVPGFNTVLTARLKNIIEHPLVARLKYVTQLGLVSLVYPTADHARYDHSLGSYTYTTYYVKSLFNDLGNPVFRNLVGTEDIKAVLLAALLHDIGQYPLAHDLEEVQEGIFKHSRIGLELLNDPYPDQYGRTLLDIISNRENGWSVSPDLFRRVVGAHSKNLDLVPEYDENISFKINVLAAIVDGQIDSDKADYIIRDSMRCELAYGTQLDLQRLLRVLTVAILPKETEPERHVTLGVYDKGLISAHAFGQARYQLLATVYWHHTSRILKAMLQYATAMALPSVVFRPADDPERMAKETEIRLQLLAFLKSLVPPFESLEGLERDPNGENATLDLIAKPPQDAIAALVSGGEESETSDLGLGIDWYPGIAWTDWLMLQWIRDLPDSTTESRNLIRGIQRRRLYKRVATFYRGDANRQRFEALDKLSWPDKVSLSRKFHERISERLRRDWANLNTATPMNESDFERLSKSELLIIIDVPTPSTKIGYARPLGVVPELKERSYQQDARQATADTGWYDIMSNMIKEIAPMRILCHPDVRNLVSNLYNPVDANMLRLLDEFLGLNMP